MNRRLIVPVLLLIAAQPATSGVTIFFDKKAETIEDKVVILNPPEFDAKSISRISQEFLGSASGKRLARLTIGTSQEAVMRTLFKMTNHPSYASTIDNIAQYHLPDTPIARVLVLQNRTSFAARPNMPGNALSRLPQNVTFAAWNVSFQLLHFTLTEPGPALRSSDYSLRVYLRASPRVSIAACIAATRVLAKMTGTYHQLLVEIRPDAWFMENIDFPAVYPFQNSLIPPNELEFGVRGNVMCGFGPSPNTDVQCSGTNFYP
jgi:hypothetical protein